MIKIATFILFLLGLRICVDYFITAKAYLVIFLTLKNRGFHAQDVIHPDELNYADTVILSGGRKLSSEEIFEEKKLSFQMELKTTKINAEMAFIEFLWFAVATIIAFLLTLSFQFNINL